MKNFISYLETSNDSILLQLNTNIGACSWIWVLKHDEKTVQEQIIGISILLGVSRTVHLIFTMSMIANLVGPHIGN